MKDWPHPGAYIILFRWKVKDDERSVWCLLPRKCDVGQDGGRTRGDALTLSRLCSKPAGKRAKYNGQTENKGSKRWHGHIKSGEADEPKGRKDQAVKLADDVLGIAAYKIGDPPAHAKRALELIPELAQALAPEGVTNYVPTIQEVNCAIFLAVEAVHATILRTNQAHPGTVLFLNERLGPASPVIGLEHDFVPQLVTAHKQESLPAQEGTPTPPT